MASNLADCDQNCNMELHKVKRFNINKMLCTLLIFIDYKKVFDTVCHKILLSKLKHYGMRDPALNLISFYLNHRMCKH